MAKKGNGLRRASYYYIYLLVVWGFFRLLFKLPEVVEEFWIKPLVWLLPLLIIWMNEKERVKFFGGSWGKAIVSGVLLGLGWVLVLGLVGWVRRGRVGLVMGEGYLDVLGAGVATAIVEELVFSGYIFQRIYHVAKDLWSAILVTGVMFALIHVPIGVFVYQYGAYQLVGFLLVVSLVNAGGNYLMAKTKNVIAPILAHWLWTVASVMIW